MSGRATWGGRGGGGDGPPVTGDGGLQVERTALAWRRTAAAFGVGATVAIRLIASTGGHWARIAGIVAGVCAVMVVAVALGRSSLVGRRSVRYDVPAAPPVTVPAPAWMAAVAVFTCLAGVATAIVVLADRT